MTVFLQLFLILVYLLFEYRRDLREKVISLWKTYKGTNSSTSKEKMKAYPVELSGHEAHCEIAPKEYTVDISFEDLTLTLNKVSFLRLSGNRKVDAGCLRS